MNRTAMLDRLESGKRWDMIVIGGGATGLGIAVDAASRGYKTVLLEQHDFAKGTSSRSTKLVHGGVRYLKQGNVSLVLEALHERGMLRKNAPHLVHDLPFIVPNYDWWEAPFYGIGLRLYDMLAGRHGFGKSRNLSKEETVEQIPTIETKGLRGGVIYYDGQFDDARLAMNLAATAADQGAVLLNYMPVVRILKNNDFVNGVIARDTETTKEYEVHGAVVINATGVFADSVRKMDDPDVTNMISPSQGVHIVLDDDYLPHDTAVMVPHTDDGRVLFAIPWHDRVVVGTTDTPVERIDAEPRALPEEVDFLLEHAAKYLSKDPTRADVRSVFAGLRPLVKGGEGVHTAALSRDHTISIARSGLITVAGGKWTTYRKMAEDTVDQAMVLGQLDEEGCVTQRLNIHGYHQNADEFDGLAIYGSDAVEIQALIRENPELGEPLIDGLPTLRAEIVWAAKHEMARTVEDALSRRTRCLLFDARKSIDAAPEAARLLAETLGKDDAWQKTQIAEYTQLAKGYTLS